MDASLWISVGKWGAGWVIRDEAGTMLTAYQVQMDGIFEPKLAEAMAFRKALSWIKYRLSFFISIMKITFKEWV